MRVADAPVRMCVLAMARARWSSTRMASPPSSSTWERQTWSVTSHATRSFYAHLPSSVLVTVTISTVLSDPRVFGRRVVRIEAYIEAQ
jgi:hypothetical protein